MRAAAAGVDIASVIGDMGAPRPHYRFNIMLQKATELCGDVKALGAELLSALEKRDAETLALLRSGHEMELLKAMRDEKKQQEDERIVGGIGRTRRSSRPARLLARHRLHESPGKRSLNLTGWADSAKGRSGRRCWRRSCI